jgi:hypothetical protein
MTYVQDMAIRGTHLADRYFLERFSRSLHALLRPLAVNLDQEVSRFPVGTMLPHSFAPHRLLSKLTQRATYLSNPQLITASPRSCSSSGQAVSSLVLPRRMTHRIWTQRMLFFGCIVCPGACLLPMCIYRPPCPRLPSIQCHQGECVR